MMWCSVWMFIILWLRNHIWPLNHLIIFFFFFPAHLMIFLTSSMNMKLYICIYWVWNYIERIWNYIYVYIEDKIIYMYIDRQTEIDSQTDRWIESVPFQGSFIILKILLMRVNKNLSAGILVACMHMYLFKLQPPGMRVMRHKVNISFS